LRARLVDKRKIRLLLAPCFGHADLIDSLDDAGSFEPRHGNFLSFVDDDLLDRREVLLPAGCVNSQARRPT
jgi:hypothetical protein